MKSDTTHLQHVKSGKKSDFKSFFLLLRTHQWIKNLMIYFAPFFAGYIFRVVEPQSLLPFISFSLASSSTYIFNDIIDLENDRHHPKKCLRPIASGAISKNIAYLTAVILVIIATAIAIYLSTQFFLLLLIYLAISICYSLKLKQFAIIDIICIASGFLIRLAAGGVAFHAEISVWLYLTVFLLALHLSAGKRGGEKIALGTTACSHRSALAGYRSGYLEAIMNITAVSVLVTYSLYVISHNSKPLLATIPLCAFGLIRYYKRIRIAGSGDPTESLLKDQSLFIIGLIWSIMVTIGIYWE